MAFLVENLDAYLTGLHTTASLTALSFAIAVVIGVVAASMRVSPVAPLRGAAALYVTLVRNSPLLVLIFLFYNGLSKVGLQYPEFTSAVIVLAAYTGTFVAETVRSGFNVVSRGQAEAARSLGLSFLQVLSVVVLPQAIRSVVPPLGSVLIALIKNSALAYFLGVADLTFTAYYVGADKEIVLAFLVAALGYLTLAIPTGLAVGWLERHTAVVR